MINAKINSILEMMVCLQCGGTIVFHRINSTNGIFVCPACFAVYCLQQGVATILPKSYLDKNKYISFSAENRSFWQSNPKLKSHFDIFTHSLSNKISKWEDDDVAFWDAKYIGGCLELQTKKLVGRAYQRNQVLFQPIREMGISNHRILEVGCGEAISAQKLLLPYGNNFIYIATDYSFQALKHLTKRLQKRTNVLYIQCLGDAIPFNDNTFDDIICLGVLHHMPKKEGHVPYLISKLKPEGLLLINEPYDRDYRLPRLLENIFQKIIEPQQSAHEERINMIKFQTNLKKGGSVIKEKHGHTPVKTVLIRITGSLYERSVGFVKFVLLIDKIVEVTIGKVWGLFSSGDCLILFKRTK